MSLLCVIQIKVGRPFQGPGGTPNPILANNMNSNTQPNMPESSTILDYTNKHILILENMVSASQMENDPTLYTDIEEEARNYGELKEQIVFYVLDNNRVNIKLIYTNSADAYKAYMAMQGRCFDGKTIKATLS